MFGVILLFLTAVMHAYVFWRTGSIPAVRRLVPGRVLYPAGAAMFGLVVLGRMFGHGRSGIPAAVLDTAGMNWLVVVFLAFFLLLAVDLVTGWGVLFRRLAPRLRLAALAACLVLSLVAVVQGLRPPVVQDHAVTLPGLPAGLHGTRLVGLSDMHIGSRLGADWLRARLDEVMALEPDMVVLLGDIFEGHDLPDEDLAPVFGRLRASLGVWAVPGNHESYGPRSRSLDILERAGITVLEDEHVLVRPGLVLAGVRDLTILARHGQGFPASSDPLEPALSGRPPGAAILLSHSPLLTSRAARLGVGLMLSGHTHGGQVWPFGWLVRLRYPHLHGLHRIGPMRLIVSRGAGTWGPRMRLWHPGEIIRVTLLSPARPNEGTPG